MSENPEDTTPSNSKEPKTQDAGNDDFDPVAAAAAAAARASQILSDKGIPSEAAPTHEQDMLSEPSERSATERPARGRSDAFIKDIDINDAPNRYQITKGATQKHIIECTGAANMLNWDCDTWDTDVSTKGRYYSDRSQATDDDPPLYLRVEAPSQESLDKAVEMIEEILNNNNGSKGPPRQPGGRSGPERP
ncbi:hypothetical protein EV182_002869, partial [Spiromyces aspiralis]